MKTMKMKKMLTCCLAMLMSLGTLAGCTIDVGDNGGGDGVEGIDLTAGTDYEGSIKVWIASDESEVAIMNSFKTAFNEVYPNITVKVEPLNSLADQLVYNAGLPSMCDVFWVSPESISGYRKHDIIQDLSTIIEADTDFDIDNLNANSVRSCMDGDTLYIMPRDYNQAVMYYNVDMFDAAGVDYPSATEAMSQDEFVQMLGELKTGLLASNETNSYGQKYSESFTNSMDASILWDSLAWPLIKSFGGTIFDENGNHLDENGNMLFNSQETYEAYKFAYDLVKNKYMGTPGEWSTKDGVQFLMETAPVYIHCRARLTTLTTPSNAYKGIQNVGVAPCPDFGDQDTYYVGSGATGYSLYSGSENKTAAWLFLKFITSERGQEEASKSGNLVPVIESLITDENAVWRTYTTSSFKEQYSNEPFVYRRDDCYTHVRDFMQYVDSTYQSDVLSRIRNCYTDSLQNVKSNPETEIKGFVAKYAKEIKKYIDGGNN